jgi:hypothetical protein
MGETPPVVEVKPTEGWRLWLRFADGVAGEVDFSYLLEYPGEVFQPLRDLDFFRQVAIYPGRGSTIFWPNEADIAPETLYERTQAAAGIAA